MGGGIMQLTASGIQDNYITGNPQITFFKSVYRRHTNFAIESVQQIIDGDLGTDNITTNSTIKISKTADLLNSIYIVCPQRETGINATELISEVELIIGGSLIDRHTNEWMKVWDELTLDSRKKEGYKYMKGNFNGFKKIKSDQSVVMIPLNFWFCRHIGLSLPLISIQYHDIVLKVEWGVNSKINRNSSSSISSICEVWCDNIFLDSEERKRFGESEHEYLIEQVQIIDTTNLSPSTKFKLNSFNHPIKEIIWTENDTGSNKITDEKTTITINGIERFSEQCKEYFSLKQPSVHHTNIPSYNIKEHEEPLFLEKPLNTGITGYDFTPYSDTFPESDYNLKVKLNSTSIDYNTNATPPFKIGDIFTLWMENLSNINQLFTVTSIEDNIDGSITTKRVNFTPSIYNGNNSFPSAPLVGSTLDIRSYIIARRSYSKSTFSHFEKNIYVYSFCLNPEEHQPSGSCNFSKFDDCKLTFTTSVSIDKVFATNYNILRISNGLTSLRFSN